jgi:hypothetical protein
MLNLIVVLTFWEYFRYENRVVWSIQRKDRICLCLRNVFDYKSNFDLTQNKSTRKKREMMSLRVCLVWFVRTKRDISLCTTYIIGYVFLFRIILGNSDVYCVCFYTLHYITLHYGAHLLCIFTGIWIRDDSGVILYLVTDWNWLFH